MSSVTSAFENLFHAVSQILGGVVQSFLAVGQSVIALFVHLVQAVFSIAQAFVTAVVDLMSGAAGFLFGKEDSSAYFDVLHSDMDGMTGNIFILLALGAGYWFWATQTAAGRQKTAGGKKNPLK
jgi:hypothetical protein